ncbi:hypothetical protein BDV29DRAFT_182279 [Aspergillus leporis]|uniref:Uncharacterized protein n=1 Tax=Aspergillus leporis TaxID=41062 RepID=A0A5N5WPL0_9EURO|nr:hypothetical protein BDV29DRAFT_182279 [Aspergillus leporis]
MRKDVNLLIFNAQSLANLMHSVYLAIFQKESLESILQCTKETMERRQYELYTR